MAMRLYNTMTRREETFEPHEPGRVTMYTCGPTVYNHTHIGHLRPALVADVLKRYLQRQGYSVFHVTNFTDVDDKIISRAAEAGVEPTVLSQRYIDDYLDNMRRLGIDGVDRYVRVTEHMGDIVAMIAGLQAKGFAYELEGDVYFDVEAKADYGKLSGRSLDELQAGARVEVDPRKRHPMDFALWKSVKPGEPSWPSPWGRGRPGWHIECSALCLRYLGPEFDIHGGGDDLVFPHHENEIAQSEATLGVGRFARYWLHNGMVRLGRQKMSKSSGNFVALRDLVRSYPAGAIRFFLLTTHYRKPLTYSQAALSEATRGWRRLAASRSNLSRMRTLTGAVTLPVDLAESPEVWDEIAPTRSTAQLLEQLEAAVSGGAERAFNAAMDADLNTSGALAALFDLARAANACINHPDVPSGSPLVLRAGALLDDLGGTLGLWTDAVADPDVPGAGEGSTAAPAGLPLVDGLVALILELRSRAREERDWPTADLLRDRLAGLGIVLEDTLQGTRWKMDGV